MGLSSALSYVKKLTDKLSIGLTKWFYGEDDGPVDAKSWAAHETGGASEETWLNMQTAGSNETTWADLET